MVGTWCTGGPCYGPKTPVDTSSTSRVFLGQPRVRWGHCSCLTYRNPQEDDHPYVEAGWADVRHWSTRGWNVSALPPLGSQVVGTSLCGPGPEHGERVRRPAAVGAPTGRSLPVRLPAPDLRLVSTPRPRSPGRSPSVTESVGIRPPDVGSLVEPLSVRMSRLRGAPPTGLRVKSGSYPVQEPTGRPNLRRDGTGFGVTVPGGSGPEGRDLVVDEIGSRG